MGNDISICRDQLKNMMLNNDDNNMFDLKSEKNIIYLAYETIGSSKYITFKDNLNLNGIGVLRFKLIRIVPEGDVESCKIIRFYGNE